jgi:hypothetical protein
MTAGHAVEQVQVAPVRYVARCRCGWQSDEEITPYALPLNCGAAHDERMRREYACVQLPLGAARFYRLHAHSGLAELIPTRGIVATKAAYAHAGEGQPLRLELEDGRSFIVELRTCEACCDTFEGPGVQDGNGHLFCDEDCRHDYEWRAR